MTIERNFRTPGLRVSCAIPGCAGYYRSLHNGRTGKKFYSCCVCSSAIAAATHYTYLAAIRGGLYGDGPRCAYVIVAKNEAGKWSIRKRGGGLHPARRQPKER